NDAQVGMRPQSAVLQHSADQVDALIRVIGEVAILVRQRPGDSPQAESESCKNDQGENESGPARPPASIRRGIRLNPSRLSRRRLPHKPLPTTFESAPAPG